jgi:hypothetical protein
VDGVALLQGWACPTLTQYWRRGYLCKGDDEMTSDCRDGIFDMTFGRIGAAAVRITEVPRFLEAHRYAHERVDTRRSRRDAEVNGPI